MKRYEGQSYNLAIFFYNQDKEGVQMLKEWLGALKVAKDIVKGGISA